MDTINIELVVTSVRMDEKVWMQGDIEILINCEKVCGEGDIVNPEILLESMISDGAFFIFSCCCGIPECSGWRKGIKVKHDGNTVFWFDENRDRKWIFDKSKMEEDIKDVKEEVKFYKKYFRKKGIEYLGTGYKWND